jgi:hypothetical protein
MPKEYMSSIAKETQPAVETEQQTIAKSEKRIATYESAIKNAKNPTELTTYTEKLQEELDVLYAYYEEKSKEVEVAVENLVASGTESTKAISKIINPVKSVLKALLVTEYGTKKVNDKIKQYDAEISDNSTNEKSVKTAKIMKNILTVAFVGVSAVSLYTVYDVAAEMGFLPTKEEMGLDKSSSPSMSIEINGEKLEIQGGELKNGTIFGTDFDKPYGEDGVQQFGEGEAPGF